MPRRILIVEADPQVARELFGFFHFDSERYEQERYEPEIAGSVAEAIEMAQNVNFDCVIMDAVLPDMDVCDAIPLMKTINNDPPIIITTGNNDLHLEANVRTQDVYYYHVRIPGTNELELAVRSVFEKLQNVRRSEQGKKHAFERVVLKQMGTFIRETREEKAHEG
jgi:DNA-binding response OmpR family regulator